MNNLRWKDYPLNRLRGEQQAHYALGEGYLYIRIPFPQMLPHVDVLTNELPEPRMTKREKEVCDMVLEAKSNKEIANKLNLSERTIKFHVSQLLEKYDCNSRYELFRAVRANSLKGALQPVAAD